MTLRHPPPLEVDLDVRTDDDGLTTLGFGGAVIAEARAAELTGELVEPVDLGHRAGRDGRYAGETGHPFPGCFVCGTDRPAPDGLGLRPGRLPDRPDTVATAWSARRVGRRAGRDRAGPDGVGSAGLPGRLVQRPGRPADGARPDDRRGGRQPAVGDPYVVVGRHLRDDGRKTFTATTAYDADGRVLGRAEAVWIALRTSRSRHERLRRSL